MKHMDKNWNVRNDSVGTNWKKNTSKVKWDVDRGKLTTKLLEHAKKIRYLTWLLNMTICVVQIGPG